MQQHVCWVHVLKTIYSAQYTSPEQWGKFYCHDSIHKLHFGMSRITLICKAKHFGLLFLATLLQAFTTDFPPWTKHTRVLLKPTDPLHAAFLVRLLLGTGDAGVSAATWISCHFWGLRLNQGQSGTHATIAKATPLPYTCIDILE